MIVYKTWQYTHSSGSLMHRKYKRFSYSGWFLFGILPLYVRRELVKEW